MIKAKKMRKIVDDMRYTSVYYRMNRLSNRMIISSSLFIATLLVTSCCYYVHNIVPLFDILPIIMIGFCFSLSAVNLSRDIEYEREYKREFAEEYKKVKINSHNNVA